MPKNRAIAERAQAEAERQQAIKTIEEQRPDVEFAESLKISLVFIDLTLWISTPVKGSISKQYT